MRLSEFITSNLEAILDDWEQYAIQIPAAKGMDKRELRDHAQQMLETIVKDLDSPQNAEDQQKKSEGNDTQIEKNETGDTAAEQHASVRMKSGFTVENLISEYRALRATVLRQREKTNKTADRAELEDINRFNEAIDQAVAESVARHSTMIRQSQDIFLSILGHDLRTPLGAVTMSAQYLMQSNALESKHVKAAAMIYNSSKEMARLIGDLLDFTRTRLGQGMSIQAEETNIANVMRQAVAQAKAFHPDRNIVLTMSGNSLGRWDASRIGQVFANLIGNAIKHGAADTPIDVDFVGHTGEVVATVHNAGKPIPEDELPRIFEPLSRSAASSRAQRHDSGLGLGLFIAKEIVQAHGGVITVDSSQKAGTSFTVRLPRHHRT
jgi:signal transduction histidine kinase